jgi:4-hydroxybenzoate polyprenyltransferase
MASSLRRLGQFVLVMFPPGLHLAYGLLWTVSFESLAVLLAGSPPWSPSPATLVRVVTVVLGLLFMRMLDEQKDYEYDVVHNPDRPLVTGAITARELRAAMAVIAVALLAINAAVAPLSAVAVLATLAYGLALWAAETVFRALREDILLNLVAALPLQALLNVYLCLSLSGTGLIRLRGVLFWELVLFACVFLHLELARKTRRGDPSEHLYPQVLGVRGSAMWTLGLALAAVGLDLALVVPRLTGGALAVTALALPGLAAVLPLLGAWRYWGRHPGRLNWPRGTAVGFVVLLCTSLVAQAVTVG